MAWYLMIWYLRDGFEDFFRDFRHMEWYDEAVFVVQGGLYFLHVYYLSVGTYSANTRDLLIPFAIAQLALAAYGIQRIFATDNNKTLDERELIEILFLIAPIVSSVGVQILPSPKHEQEEAQYIRIVKV